MSEPICPHGKPLDEYCEECDDLALERLKAGVKSDNESIAAALNNKPTWTPQQSWWGREGGDC